MITDVLVHVPDEDRAVVEDDGWLYEYSGRRAVVSEHDDEDGYEHEVSW